MSKDVFIPFLNKKVRFFDRRLMDNPHPFKRATFKTFTPPTTVLPVDSTGVNSAGVPQVSCPMDGNDSLGDCGEAMAAHSDNIFTFGRGLPGWVESTFTDQALESQYKSVSGGDNGLDEDEVVNQIWKVGIAGNPAAIITDALDFDVTNVPLTQYLLDQFFIICMAWNVPLKFQNQFGTGTIWPDALTPDPMAGHFTPLASVRSGKFNNVDVTGFYELWTWGGWCLVSPAFVGSVQPSCFVVFSPRQFSLTTGLDAHGRHITTQAAAWVGVGGNPIPTSIINMFPPISTPVPVPTPTPVPPAPVPPAPTPTPPAPPSPNPIPLGTKYTGVLTVGTQASSFSGSF